MLNGGENRTIIFNPRISSDVDLEVGNFIRIHPPWYGYRISMLLMVYASTLFFSKPISKLQSEDLLIK